MWLINQQETQDLIQQGECSPIFTTNNIRSSFFKERTFKEDLNKLFIDRRTATNALLEQVDYLSDIFSGDRTIEKWEIKYYNLDSFHWFNFIDTTFFVFCINLLRCNTERKLTMSEEGSKHISWKGFPCSEIPISCLCTNIPQTRFTRSKIIKKARSHNYAQQWLFGKSWKSSVPKKSPRGTFWCFWKAVSQLKTLKNKCVEFLIIFKNFKKNHIVAKYFMPNFISFYIKMNVAINVFWFMKRSKIKVVQAWPGLLTILNTLYSTLRIVHLTLNKPGMAQVGAISKAQKRKRTSKCQVFTFTVAEKPKNRTELARPIGFFNIHSVATYQRNWRETLCRH